MLWLRQCVPNSRCVTSTCIDRAAFHTLGRAGFGGTVDVSLSDGTIGWFICDDTNTSTNTKYLRRSGRGESPLMPAVAAPVVDRWVDLAVRQPRVEALVPL